MLHTGEHDISNFIQAAGPLIAYVYGDAPPDFAAIAACGFEVVCVDTRARWFGESTLVQARAHGLRAVAFPMSYRA